MRVSDSPKQITNVLIYSSRKKHLLCAEPQGPGDALQVVDEHAGRKGGREGPAAGGSNRATRASPEDEASAWSPGQGLLPSPSFHQGFVSRLRLTLAHDPGLLEDLRRKRCGSLCTINLFSLHI